MLSRAALQANQCQFGACDSTFVSLARYNAGLQVIAVPVHATLI